jgi:hypothetical protein
MLIHLRSVDVLPLLQAEPGTAAGAIQVASEISTVVIAVLVVLFLVAMVPLILQLKRLLAVLQHNIQPVTDRARVAAENVEYISAVVREDVLKVRESVAGLSDRLKQASERMEERVEEFNALMDVVQDEAEAVLLDTAAVVRGVRAGAQTMGEGVARGQTASGGSSAAAPKLEPSDPVPERSTDNREVENDTEARDEPAGEGRTGEAMAGETPERR